ncbi:MAG: hypothetical protein KBC96_11255 [Armatimonadetes bacterium]|nr:hypothetical protein [Armatimonadota bacterium]
MNTTALIALAALCLAATASAEIVHLGQPCQARNVLAGRVVIDRASGRDMLVLSNMNENAGAELIFIDPEKDFAKVFTAPAGAGSWALNEVSGDRLVVGTFYDGRFMVFDLRKMEFTQVSEFPGESYIWNLAIGSDGRVYGGTYGGGKLGALDLNAYSVEDLGNPAPPNMYLRYVTALPDGRILCSFGQEKNTTMIFDPAKKDFIPVPKSIKGVLNGVSWHGYFLAGGKAYKGKTLYEVPAPFPTPPAEKGAWSVDSYASNDDMLVLYQGNRRYTYRFGEKDLRFIADINLRGGRVLAYDREGNLLGVRGQDYFVMKPGDTKLNLRRIPGESAPRQTHFLRADEKGRLWGGPTFGQTLWFMDPATKKVTNTSTICDGGGEVYDVAFHGGETFAVAYAGGDIVRYNADKPWNQWDNENPRVIAHLGSKGYIRPIGGTVFGPDGKLYTGWMAQYGRYGGAISITDPARDKTDLIENPLGEQAMAGIAVDSKYIYAGTSLAGNGLPNKKGESAGFCVIDVATREIVYKEVYEGATSVRPLGCSDKLGRAAVTGSGKVRIFDSASPKWVEGIPSDIPVHTCNSIASTPDARLIYGSENSIIALDLATGGHEHLADAPARVENVALGPDGTVYFSCGVDVYAVK